MGSRGSGVWAFGLVVALAAGASATAAQERGVDVVLLVDRSASMKQNDPLNLRLVGAQQFVDLARPIDRVSVWQFAEAAKAVVPPTVLSDDSARQAVKQGIRSLDATGTSTDITGALEAVFHEMNANPQAELRRYVILLTDGKIDVPGGESAAQKSRARLLDVVLPKFQSRKWPVYAIGLSGKVDEGLMQAVAEGTRQTVGLQSKGFYQRTDSAEGLPAILARMLAQMADWVTVGVNAPEHSYKLDATLDRRALLVANKQPETEIVLGTPGGDELRPGSRAPNVSWVVSDRYAVAKIDGPETGRYQLKFIGKGGQSLCFSESEVWLRPVEWEKANYEQREAIRMGIGLMKGDRAWTDPAAKTKVGAQFSRGGQVVGRVALLDNGTGGDKSKGDGTFTGYFDQTDQDGLYSATATAEGDTFTRVSDSVAVAVSGSPSVEFAVARPTYRRGEVIALSAKLTRPIRKPTCAAEVSGPGGVDRLALGPVGEGAFAGQYKGATDSGRYFFLLTLTGQADDGREVRVLKQAGAQVGTPEIEVTCTRDNKHINELKLKVTSRLDYAENLIIRCKSSGYPNTRLKAEAAPAASELRVTLAPGATTEVRLALACDAPFWSPRTRKATLGFAAEKMPGTYIDPAELSVDLSPESLVHRLYGGKRWVLAAGIALILLGLGGIYWFEGTGPSRVVVVLGLLVIAFWVVLLLS